MNKRKHIEQHFRENYDSLVKRIRARNCDVPEDVVQEAYYRALKYYSTYSKDKDFDRWFNTILNNSLRTIKNEEKERGITREVREEELPYEPDVIRDTVHSIIEGLPEGREKQILYMYYILGFTTREVSEYMNLTHPNVRIIIMRWKENYALSN